MLDEFHKVTVSIREESYGDQPPTYALRVVRMNHGSTLHPPFFDREVAERFAQELQNQYDIEQPERVRVAEESHARHERQLRERMDRDRQEWEAARVRNVGDEWARTKSARIGQEADVVEYLGHKLKVRYDDGRTVTSKRSNFRIVGGK